MTRQHGALSNPYRRAVVRTTLFPESVPGDRSRYPAVVALAWFVGWGTAVHLRQGAYADTWGVASVVPELQIAKAFGERGLVAVRYRFVGQTQASFYRVAYLEVEPRMTGDPRLGSLREHAAALSARWTVLGVAGEGGALTVFVEEEVSRLHFRQLPVNDLIHASVTTAGLGLLF